MKPQVKKFLFAFVTLSVLAVLAFGAVALPFILHAWIVSETGETTIALVVSVAVFIGFAISLGVVVGVYNFLRGLRKTKTTPTAVKRLLRGPSN